MGIGLRFEAWHSREMGLAFAELTCENACTRRETRQSARQKAFHSTAERRAQDLTDPGSARPDKLHSRRDSSTIKQIRFSMRSAQQTLALSDDFPM